jgi:hypothetical protein
MNDGVNGHITRLPYSELYDVVVTNQHSTRVFGSAPVMTNMWLILCSLSDCFST